MFMAHCHKEQTVDLNGADCVVRTAEVINPENLKREVGNRIVMILTKVMPIPLDKESNA